MPRARFKVHPAAAREARDAYRWYHERSPDAARRFVMEPFVEIAPDFVHPMRQPHRPADPRAPSARPRMMGTDCQRRDRQEALY